MLHLIPVSIMALEARISNLKASMKMVRVKYCLQILRALGRRRGGSDWEGMKAFHISDDIHLGVRIAQAWFHRRHYILSVVRSGERRDMIVYFLTHIYRIDDDMINALRSGTCQNPKDSEP